MANPIERAYPSPQANYGRPNPQYLEMKKKERSTRSNISFSDILQETISSQSNRKSRP